MLQFMPRSVFAPRRKDKSPSITLHPDETIEVHDSIAAVPEPGLSGDPSDGEREVISNLMWEPGTFTAAASKEGDADLAVRFPSPKPQGNPYVDTVVLDWHYARDRFGTVLTAPAVIVLDILQGGHRVAGYIAKNLASKGLHAFILHLPQSGRRVKPGTTHDWSAFLPSLKQGASDARRARDVIASLPLVRGGVSLQGTSLGGFVATMAASLDACFDCNILALTGGDVFGILSRGKMDAVRVRESLRKIGMTDNKLREELWKIEPLRIAHRMNPKKTWLFSARYDQVVPREHSKLLAEAINLDCSHHRHLSGCHYTCAINARRFMQEMVRAIPNATERRDCAGRAFAIG